jgi:carbon-monoxide dehydrogenase large subunit
VTTKLFGERVQRVEDAKLVTGQAYFLDDLGHDALAAAFVRSPHAHARIIDIDVAGALDVEGLVAIYAYDDLAAATCPVGEPLPLLIPHPALYAPRTGYALARDEVNHVGEAVVMVVASDRYVAEDAAERITVTYAVLPPVVGVDNARRAERTVHDDVPDNVAAHLVQEVGDVESAMAAAPRTLDLELSIERSASMPMEGKGVYARWDAADASMRVYSSTQTTTGVRAAVAAKLDLPLNKVDCIAPMVGGGFGVKIVHPWPEEVLVPWAARELNREVKWVEDRREHFVSSAHERGQLHSIKVGYDDAGRLLALDVKIWHDNGAYTPYGIIVPIITATQLLGPYKPGAYRVEFWSLYTNTVIVTPYRGAGRPQACFAMERTLDAIADALGLDRAEVRARNFITPEEMPYDHQLTFQDGRPLIYDSGDFPASLDKLKGLIGWDATLAEVAAARASGRRLGVGLACYVEGTGVGPYEGAHVVVESSGKVKVATGLTTQGQGHFTAFAQIVADELGVPFSDVEIVTGDTRRFGYAVGTFASRAAVMSGNAIALASRKVRAKAVRIAGDALEVDPGDLEIVDGVVRVKGSPGSSIPLATVAVLSNPLRYAFDEASKAATQFAVGDTSGPPVADDDEPGLLTDAGDVRERHARGRGRVRPGHRGDHRAALLRRARLRSADQPAHRRGPGARRRRAGCRGSVVRADGLRRERPAAQRVVHGLSDALCLRDPDDRDRPPRDPVTAEPVGHQGGRGSRCHPVGRGLRVRDRGRGGFRHLGHAHLAERAVRPAPASRGRCRPVTARSGARARCLEQG